MLNAESNQERARIARRQGLGEPQMKHIITMGLVTLLTTHTAWANPSAFKELDRETGDCEADVNTLKKEIKVCEAKASKASTLEIKLRDSSNNLAASELKAEQLALTLKSKNVEIRKSKKQLKKAQNDLLQLAFSYKELEGKLKESQAYLDQEKTANQKLTKQLMESEKKPKEPISTTPPPTQTKPIKQAEPHPKTQLAGPLHASPEECESQGSSIICKATLLSPSEDIHVSSRLLHAVLYDTAGNRYRTNTLSLGNVSVNYGSRSSSVSAKVIEATPTVITLVFNDVSNQSTAIAKLEFTLLIDGQNYEVGFRSIPLKLVQ